MSLTPNDENMLQEIRSKYGDKYRQSRPGQHAASDADDNGLPGESTDPTIGYIDQPVQQAGTPVEYPGTSSSLPGRPVSEYGEDYPREHPIVPGATSNSQRDEGYSGGAGGRVTTASPRINIPSKPRGIIGLLSTREKEERASIDPNNVKVKKLVQVTAKGRVQLLLDNGKFMWLDGDDERLRPIDLNNIEGATIPLTPPLKLPSQSKPPPQPQRSTATATPQPAASPQQKKPPSTRELLKVRRGVMSESEASAIKDSYEDALVALFELLDKTMTNTTPGRPTVVIWSDMDDQQIEIIAVSMLQLSQTHEEVAVVVRQTVNLYQHGKLITILAPRFYKTYIHYFTFGFDMPGLSYRKKVVRNRV